jgi:hypothetical protein
LGKLTAGTHTYSITATDKDGDSTTTPFTGTFSVVAGVSTLSLPTIGNVLVVEATGTRDGTLTTDDSILMTWSATDSNSLAHSTLQVDGRTIATVWGPYATNTGANFSSVLGKLTAGTHTYSITAVDKSGNSTTPCTGTFQVTAASSSVPTIANLVIVAATGPNNGTLTSSDSLLMTWSALDPDGVARSTLQIDGRTVASVWGPYATSSGANFASMIGTFTAGTHSYSITATDKQGHSTASAFTGTFQVAAEQELNAINLSVNATPSNIAASQDLVTSVTTDQPAAIVTDAKQRLASRDWFIDPTPADDAEYSELLAPHVLAANQNSPAANRADLLTAVMQEMENELGQQNSDSALSTLSSGV